MWSLKLYWKWRLYKRTMSAKRAGNGFRLWRWNMKRPVYIISAWKSAANKPLETLAQSRDIKSHSDVTLCEEVNYSLLPGDRVQNWWTYGFYCPIVNYLHLSEKEDKPVRKPSYKAAHSQHGTRQHDCVRYKQSNDLFVSRATNISLRRRKSSEVWRHAFERGVTYLQKITLPSSSASINPEKKFLDRLTLKIK